VTISESEADLTSDLTSDLAITFKIALPEEGGEPGDALVQEIRGEITLSEDDREPYAVGTVTAELFNVLDLAFDGSLFIAYDSRSDQLTDAFTRLFTYQNLSWRAGPLAAAGFEIGLEPRWHLHASGLYVERGYRGRRVGLRALRLLKRFAARPHLIATAKAFPQEDVSSPPPKPHEIRRLARYYRSDSDLAFRPHGALSEGWLIADWSI
jgi:GNAT superfamily N-acetyltransferase